MPQTKAESKRRVDFFLALVPFLYDKFKKSNPNILSADVRKVRKGKATKTVGTQKLRNKYVKPNDAETKEGRGPINRI